MTEFNEIVRARRSIRNYEERMVPDEILYKILDTVKWTPSWANTQCWEIIVVKDAGIKIRLQGAMEKTNPAWKSLAAAPVVLAVCGKLESAGYYKGSVTTKFGDWFLFDLGLASQTLCLAAQNEGLGTVITGLFDHDKAKEVLKVPAGYELVSLIPMGYPAKTPSVPKRRDTEEFVHKETF
ncbi:MAG: nitroreductase family protein [Pseudomonadota bacterium]